MDHNTTSTEGASPGMRPRPARWAARRRSRGDRAASALHGGFLTASDPDDALIVADRLGHHPDPGRHGAACLRTRDRALRAYADGFSRPQGKRACVHGRARSWFCRSPARQAHGPTAAFGTRRQVRHCTPSLSWIGNLLSPILQNFGFSAVLKRGSASKSCGPADASKYRPTWAWNSSALFQ